ncbi:MAG: hypothetical protein K2N73_00515 [Lachnospiraceae bacterium]|nr:hypothetical protein [Lachnospiraceae bacterium]
MESNFVTILFTIWFILRLVWSKISTSISRELINIMCRVVVVIDICLFLLTIKLFQFWLLIFYIMVGMFFLNEKFGRWTEAAYMRRNYVSSMQDCIMTVGTFMIAISLMFLSMIK